MWTLITAAPLAWVLWIPENQSILEQWVPKTINLGKERNDPFSVQIKQEIGVKTFI